MEQYANRSGNSNVASYLCGDNFIVIKFKSGGASFYLYDARRPGALVVERMQALARRGMGLNAFTKTQVGNNFSAKGSSLAALGL